MSLKLSEKLTGPLIRLALPTAVRQGLAAVAGFLAVSPESGLADYLVAGLTMVVTWVWSYFERREPAADTVEVIRNLARALASQLMAALAGVLVEHGYTGDANDPFGVILWGANYAHSVSVKRREQAGGSGVAAPVPPKPRRSVFKR